MVEERDLVVGIAVWMGPPEERLGTPLIRTETGDSGDLAGGDVDINGNGNVILAALGLTLDPFLLLVLVPPPPPPPLLSLLPNVELAPDDP